MTAKPLRTLLFLAVTSVGLIFAVGALTFLGTARAPTALLLPNPNGYADLLNAARIVTRRIDNPADLDRAELRALLATNVESLRLVRLGLSHDCAVPTDSVITNFGATTGDLIGLKCLARLLSAEGRLAEIEDRSDDAARSYVDAIRLGTAMSRGGLVMNRLVGIACEGVGSMPLAKLVPKLTFEQARSLVTELQQIDQATVTWEEVCRNENRFASAQMGHYGNPIRLGIAWWQTRAIRKRSQERHNIAAAYLRLTTTELALRCYQHERGTIPARLELLVPKYLRQVPSDPFSSHALVYRPRGTNWLLYSVGPDRVDDNGKPAGRMISGHYLVGLGENQRGRDQKTRGDLLYDSSW